MKTQNVIAKATGATQASVSGWLNGLHRPHPMFRKQLEAQFPEELKKMEEKYASLHLNKQ